MAKLLQKSTMGIASKDPLARDARETLSPKGDATLNLLTRLLPKAVADPAQILLIDTHPLVDPPKTSSLARSLPFTASAD